MSHELVELHGANDRLQVTAFATFVPDEDEDIGGTQVVTGVLQSLGLVVAADPNDPGNSLGLAHATSEPPVKELEIGTAHRDFVPVVDDGGFEFDVCDDPTPDVVTAKVERRALGGRDKTGLVVRLDHLAGQPVDQGDITRE